MKEKHKIKLTSKVSHLMQISFLYLWTFINYSMLIGMWGIFAHPQHENMHSQTRLEMELLCSCNLTSKVIQCNAMKFTKNLMRCVQLEDTKTLWENRNSPWWNVKGIMLMFIQCHAWWLNPFCSIHHNIYI